MKMISLGSIPLSSNLGSMLSGMGSSDRELFDPKNHVAWTNLKYISDSERGDRGMLVVKDEAVAVVFSRQMTYKDALTYDNNIDGRHVIIFKGCDQTPDGVVCISVGSVDNLALITASDNLPEQVVFASSFNFGESNLPKLTEELKRCGYELIGDDNTFRGEQAKWSHVLVDTENSIIVGYLTKPGGASRMLGDDIDDAMPGLGRLLRGVSRDNDEEGKIGLNLTTTDSVLIEALIDFSEQVELAAKTAKPSDWRSQCS